MFRLANCANWMDSGAVRGGRRSRWGIGGQRSLPVESGGSGGSSFELSSRIGLVDSASPVEDRETPSACSFKIVQISAIDSGVRWTAVCAALITNSLWASG